MNTRTMSNRVAAGVTAAYVRDLSRRSASKPGGGGRRATGEGRRVRATGLGRSRDDHARRHGGSAAVARARR
jgi:hypothetical protein